MEHAGNKGSWGGKLKQINVPAFVYEFLCVRVCVCVGVRAYVLTRVYASAMFAQHVRWGWRRTDKRLETAFHFLSQIVYVRLKTPLPAVNVCVYIHEIQSEYFRFSIKTGEAAMPVTYLPFPAVCPVRLFSSKPPLSDQICVLTRNWTFHISHFCSNELFELKWKSCCRWHSSVRSKRCLINTSRDLAGGCHVCFLISFEVLSVHFLNLLPFVSLCFRPLYFSVSPSLTFSSSPSSLSLYGSPA